MEPIYADVPVTTCMPISPLKDRKSSQSSKNPLYLLIEIYCIISLNFYFNMSGIVFVLVWFLDTLLCLDL